MITLKLFWEFFKIGLFAVGGGLATIPFLYNLSTKTNWISFSDISNMIAISEATPGPLGINMATYTGFLTNGIIGSIFSTLGLVIPSIIIIIVISKFLNSFGQNKIIKKLFYGLRAGVTALILISGISVLKGAIFFENFSIKLFESILFIIILILLQKTKIHPIWYILVSGLIGAIFAL